MKRGSPPSIVLEEDKPVTDFPATPRKLCTGHYFWQVAETHQSTHGALAVSLVANE